MSTRYEISIDVAVAPGRTSWALWATTHALAMGAAVRLPLPMALVGAGITAMSAAWWMLRWRRGWRRIIWNGWGGIQAIRSDGRVEFVELGDRHFATSRLVVLNIRKEKRNMRFPVFAWEQPEAVRRLNQRLQAGRAPRPVDLDAGDRSGV